jgi:hypothetical protein
MPGGQRFLTLDTGKLVVRNRWKEPPMTSDVIDRVNLLGRSERSLLVFTDRLGRAIGDYTPTENVAGDDEES